MSEYLLKMPRINLIGGKRLANYRPRRPHRPDAIKSDS